MGIPRAAEQGAKQRSGQDDMHHRFSMDTPPLTGYLSELIYVEDCIGSVLYYFNTGQKGGEMCSMIFIGVHY